MNIAQRLDEVRSEYLRRMTSGRGDLLRSVEAYAVQRMGKMLRPRMVLEAAATLGDAHAMERWVLLLAVCVEMLHNTSLLHDDVIDHAGERRGTPSVNVRWNSSVAVLVGDYHLAQIMALLDEVDRPDAARMVNRTVMDMVEAELLQQEHLAGRAMSEADYLDVIDGKTASLFATAAALGNPAFRDFGLCYGRLFQLYDDLRDGEAPAFATALIDSERQRMRQLQGQGLALAAMPLPSLQMQ
ncbi:MAG: polyprenyl synthetase family protein [Bacteroidales bacterium]|nr:polyprenyl synthetase family protein [Bacteroidales bacterium]